VGCCDGTPLTSPDYQTLSETVGRVDALEYGTDLVHHWGTDGWGPFAPVLINADDAQVFATTVVTGSGVITGTQAGDGNMRVAYVRECTEWTDSEMTSLIVGPAGWNTINAQQGHLHRVREVSPGLWEGIAVWTAVVGGDYSLINTRGVRFDGATLFQSDGDLATSADSSSLDRGLRVEARQRFNFVSWFNEYRVSPLHLWGLAVGDIVTITSVSGTGFNETGVAVANADRVGGVVQVGDPSDTTTVAYAITPGGLIVPSGIHAQKRWAPFWLSTRVVGGTASAATVEWLRWRYGEPRPDWSDARVQRRAIASNANVPALATGPGLCGLWGAHFTGGSSGAYGQARFREVCRPT
jgi:hypothetical protein